MQFLDNYNYFGHLKGANEVNRQYFQQAVLLCLLKALYYARKWSYAACIILCPKLCWHNSPRPTYMTSFSHVVGPQRMHELRQQTCCVKYT